MIYIFFNVFIDKLCYSNFRSTESISTSLRLNELKDFLDMKINFIINKYTKIYRSTLHYYNLNSIYFNLTFFFLIIHK